MILSTNKVKKIKPLIFLLLLTPSIFWSVMFIQNKMGANPIDKFMDELGRFSLQLIIATLLISSLSKFKFLRSLQIFRRMVGLFAFYYVLMHFLSYVILDHFFNLQFIIKDILKRPFITFGFFSFLLFLPLVVTSTNQMVKRLTYKIWKKIHYLIYIIAPLATLHFLLLTKANKTEPLIYLGIVVLLLIWRINNKLIKFFRYHLSLL